MGTAADALVSTVQRLWPERPGIRLVRERGMGSAGSRGFVVVPHANAPRLLVPLANPRAASRAMRRYSAALSTGDTVQRLGVAGLLRSGGSVLFADRVTVPPDGGGAVESLQSYLSRALGADVVFSIGIGSVRANRKPVLEIFDRQGRSVAFAKLGDSTTADTHVRAEATALEAVHGRLRYPVLAPEIIHQGTWDGVFVLVMSSLETTPRQRPSRQWEIPETAMRALADSFYEGRMALHRTPMWGRMEADVAGLADAELRRELTLALGELLDQAGDRSLGVGAWHGDWTPWNMARRGGMVQLWDWERFAKGVPVGLDRFHYGVNAVSRRHGANLASVRDGLARAGATDPAARSEQSVLAGVYLAAVATRYVASSETEFGDAIRERGRMMVHALTEWLERGRR